MTCRRPSLAAKPVPQHSHDTETYIQFTRRHTCPHLPPNGAACLPGVSRSLLVELRGGVGLPPPPDPPVASHLTHPDQCSLQQALSPTLHAYIHIHEHRPRPYSMMLPRTCASPGRHGGGSSSRRNSNISGGNASSWWGLSIAKWAWLSACVGLLGLSLHFWADTVWVGVDKGGGSVTLSHAIRHSLRLTSKRPLVGTKNRPLLIVGTHHKTGTALMALVLREAFSVHKSLTGGKSSGVMMGFFGNAERPGAPYAFYYCDQLYADTWNKTDSTSTEHLPKLVDNHQFFNGHYKFVHLVRDPVELVISAYLYHHGGPPDWQEVWLYEKHPLSNYKTVMTNSSCDPKGRTEMSWFDVLRCLNQKEGLLAEALFQTYFGALPSMVAAVKHIHGHHEYARVLQLGLEEFQSNFDGTVARMFEFLGFGKREVGKIVEGCAPFDLQRQSQGEKERNEHVTAGKFDKGILREIMGAYDDPVFKEARRVLGYPKEENVVRTRPAH